MACRNGSVATNPWLINCYTPVMKVRTAGFSLLAIVAMLALCLLIGVSGPELIHFAERQQQPQSSPQGAAEADPPRSKVARKEPRSPQVRGQWGVTEPRAGRAHGTQPELRRFDCETLAEVRSFETEAEELVEDAYDMSDEVGIENAEMMLGMVVEQRLAIEKELEGQGVVCR